MMAKSKATATRLQRIFGRFAGDIDKGGPGIQRIMKFIEELTHHEPWYGEFDDSHIGKIHEWEEEKAGERLDQICEDYLKGCPLYLKEIAIGDPAEEIIIRLYK